MNRRMLLVGVSLLILGAAVVYWRRHHFVKSTVSLSHPQDAFKDQRTPATWSNPPAPSAVDPRVNRPPNQTQSPDVQRSIQTIQEINRINKLNADQRKNSHSQ